MSNRDEGIELNKINLKKNYYSLFDMMSGKLNNNKMSFKERILLLNTILRDENGLKRLLEKSDDKSYSFLYYLLNKIKNKKLKDIITKSQKNTGKKNLLEGIVLKAKELIKSIDTKEEERKTKEEERKKEKKLNERKTKIDMYKTYILEHIEDYIKSMENIKSMEKLSDDADYNERNKDEKFTDDDAKNYIVLKKQVIIEKEDSYEGERGRGSTTIYYLLYNELNIFTMKTVLWGSKYNNPNYIAIEPPILLDNEINFDHFTLLSKLYNDLNPNPSNGGKLTTTPVYKLNGEKVSLLINKTKLHRSVYVKGNGNRKVKYCKINNEFVLLSKLKNKIIEI